MQVLLILVAPVLFLYNQSIGAAELSQRSIRVHSSRPSANTRHTVRFTTSTSAVLGSIELEYCTNSPFVGTACTAPAGLNASGALISSQSGITGFTKHGSTTANRYILTRVPIFSTAQSTQYELSSIINPSASQTTIFVRISTYASDDASGARIDSNAVTFSTSGQLRTTGYVPPYLTFCVGITVSGGCNSVTGVQLKLGVFSPVAARSATTQMAVATNDPTGYALSLSGLTLTSGNNTIPAMTASAASSPGTSQFGINLRSNTVPAVGLNPVGLGTGIPAPSYNVPNKFTFKNGLVASSTLPTDYNLFTVSYIANINPDQSPGVYSTTFTYIATVSF